MQTFTVHEPADPSADRVDRAERLVFVRDGFSWVAALFAPIWLLAYRLWWALLGYIIIAGGLQFLKLAAPFDQRWIGLALFALNLLVGLEADTLRRWALDRRGWRVLGSVTGRSAAECERRFFELWLPAQPIITPATAAMGSVRFQSPRLGERLSGLLGRQ